MTKVQREKRFPSSFLHCIDRKWCSLRKKTTSNIFVKLTNVRFNKERDLICFTINLKKQHPSLVWVVCFMCQNQLRRVYITKFHVFTLSTVNHSSYNANVPVLLHQFSSCVFDTVCLSFNLYLLYSCCCCCCWTTVWIQSVLFD